MALNMKRTRMRTPANAQARDTSDFSVLFQRAELVPLRDQQALVQEWTAKRERRV